MHHPTALLLALPLLATLMADFREAHACGGCFHPPEPQSRGTQVTGHRMILSISKDQTTLYDQIEYVGAPEDFAWVLPIRGQVEVGLSSDALFSLLEQRTAVTINAPAPNCPVQPQCDFGSGGSVGTGGSSNGGSGSGVGGGGGAAPGVEILAEQTVGPYETVQLSATDPAALNDWLTAHDYAIPADVQPVIDQYVLDGMDFLAMRLAPGANVQSMRPVRVTTPGAGPVLPLRMVAAGTGATTSVTLWVIAEGRYEPQNFPSFLISSDDLVWNWDTSRSNYAELKQAGFDAGDGSSWLVDWSKSVAGMVWLHDLVELAEQAPSQSGYANDDGSGAAENAQADIDALTFGLSSKWMTRMSAELPRTALGADLILRATLGQVAIPSTFNLTNSVGTPPCPPVFECNGDGGANTQGSSTDAGCDCVTGSSPMRGDRALWAAVALASLGLWRRRRVGRATHEST